MKRKIFAGLCAFSMAIGAKGGSEKVAAAPIDTVRYGAQALLYAFEIFVSGLMVASCIKDKVEGYGYWYNGSGRLRGSGDSGMNRFQKIGSHWAVVHGLTGIYSSLKNCLKSEPNPRKNSKDAIKFKSSTVSESNVAKNDSKSSGKLLSGVQLVTDVFTFLGFACTIKGVHDSIIEHERECENDPKPGLVKDTVGDKILMYGIFSIPTISGFYGTCSNGYDFLKSEPKPRIRPSNANPSLEKDKSEKDLKDKK